MRLKKFAPVFFVLTLMLCILNLTVYADISRKPEIVEHFVGTTPVKASGSFSMSIPANTLMTANSSFPMEIGESITISAYYSPSSASVDFGFIAPDGLFYAINTTNGHFNQSIVVSQHGYYTLAIRNNSSGTIVISGLVNY